MIRSHEDDSELGGPSLVARRLELTDPVIVPGQIEGKYRGLRLRIELDSTRWTLRLDAPRELPGTFDANQGTPDTFDQLTLGDPTFDAAVRVRCADDRRVSLLRALEEAPALREGLVRLVTARPSASIGSGALTVTVSPAADESDLSRLTVLLREGASILEELARLEAPAESLPPLLLDQLASKFSLDRVDRDRNQLSGVWDGLGVTFELRGQVIMARLTPLNSVGGPYTRTTVVGPEIDRDEVREELAKLFTASPTATIAPKEICLSEPVTRVAELERALRIAGPLSVSLGRLELRRGQRLPNPFDGMGWEGMGWRAWAIVLVPVAYVFMMVIHSCLR